MKKIIMMTLVVSTNVCLAQVVDDFSDNDLTNHPTWNGTVNHFMVNASQQLQLNNTVASTSYLTLPFVPDWSGELQWDIFVRQNFSSSGNNFGRIYLVADQPTLTEPLNGYFIQLGEAGSNDAIELFRQTGSTNFSVCRGTGGQIASAFTIRLQVTRSPNGEWTILGDLTGGSELLPVASGTDNSDPITGYFGLLCTYTAGNANRFYFDDIYAGPPPGDTTPPAVQQLTVIDDKNLHIIFSEPLQVTSALTTNNYSVAGHHPVEVALSNDVEVNLTFGAAFTNGLLTELVVDGIADVHDNYLAGAVVPFRYFHELAATPKDIVINEFFPDPSPVIGLPQQEFIEFYNRSKKAFNLAGWILADATSKVILPEKFVLPGEYLIVAPTAAANYNDHGSTLLLANFPTLNNSTDVISLRDPTGLLIDSIQFSLAWYHDDDKAQGGYSIERLAAALPSSKPSTWAASKDPIGGTPGRVNSVDGESPDKTPPVVLSAAATSATEIAVTFSEPIKANTFTTANIAIEPPVVTGSVQLTNDALFAAIALSTPLVNGHEYNLSITLATDTAGNVMLPYKTVIMHFVNTPASYKNVIITEIMSDPAPVVALPEAEYIEIFNNTGTPFDLKGWMLCDSRDTAYFPSHIIQPKQYRIVCAPAQVQRFVQYGRAIGVPSFPSLANAGEPIRIVSAAGLTIDSVNYVSGWHSDRDKADGGWSMELIDPDNSCGEQGNWTSSEADAGGTPGQPNSVLASKPDLTGPKLVSTRVVDDHTLEVVFNEKLSKDLSKAVINVEQWSGEYGLGFTDGSLTAINIKLTPSLQPRVRYTLSLSNIRDCAGNAIDESTSFQFAIAEPALPGDIILNEVLFNPLPNGVDFIELFNVSEKYIDLDRWVVSNMKNNQSISLPSIVVSPGGYIVLTGNVEILRNYYPSGIEATMHQVNIPAMSDDEGEILLSDSSGVLIDRLNYNEGMHHAMLRSNEGFSLERISAQVPSDNTSNWKSGSTASGGATPGYINSNSRSEFATGDRITVDPEIISFREPDQFAQILFQFDQPGYVANVNVYDAEGRLIKEIARNEPLATQGFLRWDGDHNSGSRVRTGYYVVRFEVFDTSGHVSVFRKMIAMAP